MADSTRHIDVEPPATVTQRWARACLATPFEALPADAVHAAKRLLLDFLGVAVAGAATPVGRIALDLALTSGGHAEATAVLAPMRLPAAAAAWVNGVCGHALDLDDGHRAAAGHPGVATWPAALAAAELAATADLSVQMEAPTSAARPANGPPHAAGTEIDGRQAPPATAEEATATRPSPMSERPGEAGPGRHLAEASATRAELTANRVPGGCRVPASGCGRELLRATVLGYEVFVRLAALVNPEHLRRGFHTTATVGPFAGALAAGLLLGLDEARLTAALGLAGTTGAGLMEVFHDGAMAKPLQVGRAASAGVLAAQLAARGAAGPRAIVEGDQGFLAAMCGPRELRSLVEGWGEDWAIRGVYLKEHAACRHTHAAVDAAAALRAGGLRPDAVERIVVQTYEVADRLCGAPHPQAGTRPRGPQEAKFSLPFTVALGLTLGHARRSGFTPELIADPGLRALAGRVRVELDPELDRRYPVQRAARLVVTTTDGRRLVETVEVARGEPERPLSDAEVEAKFLDNVADALPPERARAIIEAVRALDTLPTCAPLMTRLRGS